MPTYLRRTLFSLCLALFSFSLLSLPWSHLATVTILNRDVVKGWLDKSGAYDKLGSFMAESTKMDGSVSDDALATQDPRINQIFQDAVAPTFSSENANKTVDGVYDWLSGKTETLKLTSDIQSIKQRLADEMSKYAGEKATSLPVCTPEQTAGFAADGQTDLWSTSCLPPGTNPAQVQADVKNQILTSKNFLSDGTNATDSIATADEQVQKNLQGMQTTYQLALIGPLIFGTLAVLSGAAAVFLSSNHRKGLQRICITAITSGVITGLSALVFNFSLDAVGHSDNALISGIAVTISGDIVRVLTIWSIGLIVIGAAALAAVWYFGRQKPPVKSAPAKK